MPRICYVSLANLVSESKKNYHFSVTDGLVFGLKYYFFCSGCFNFSTIRKLLETIYMLGFPVFQNVEKLKHLEQKK